MDLYGSYMSHARIPMVDLSGADLRDSDFMGAILRRANLSGCYLNPIHLYRADLRQADLSRTLMNRANLRGADLRDANLQNADMDNATLSDANLTGANLTGANLARANLDRANLTNADLTNVVFHGAALTRTNLTGANLSGADLYAAILNDTPLTGTQFAGCIIGYTVFQNCDLSDATGLDQVRHDAPSTVGIDTLFRSGGRIPDIFLQGAGSPESLLSFQRSLLGQAPMTGDIFISCSDKDVSFGEKLQNGLRELAVRCWLFPESYRGSALVDRRSTSEQEEVERWVRHYDRMIVVCSQAALDSETVRNDITKAKEQQQSRDKWVLYLVSPDDTMVQPRARVARDLSYEHVVFDLRGFEDGSEHYQKELARLAGELKQSQPARAGVPAVSDQL
jgi:uncharacterized protein YjbI with pentapeptide repeats